MRLEKFLPYYKKLQNCLSKNYPPLPILENISYSDKINTAMTFSIFKKLNSSVKQLEKRKIDCSDFKKQIEIAHEYSGKQRRMKIRNIQLGIATKNLEHAQSKKQKFKYYFAKSTIRDLKHPIIKQVKKFAIASGTGILINKNNIKESAKTEDSFSLFKKICSVGITFGTIPILFKIPKGITKLHTLILGSKLPLTATFLSIAISLIMGICIFSKIKQYLSNQIFQNDEIRQKQTSDENTSFPYEC